ncbi:FAD/FMN-containing dehydrogenase [Pseudomonas nitritireducens]|uniref:FAD/FMN-containing dehydrogenase n=1 Tax=Pseudomonas nitroreducens TaxID=46680 RepID=A0A7W7KIA5_PSENT|nr:FAD-binding oxidoreductase [Pseudomonas nitritireducens]MBB4862981.1 FAD/FMN-containing dehydrogenase [Pseudomonas nitritireducens]
MSRSELCSWGRYPQILQRRHACAWRDELAASLDLLARIHQTTLPYGNGRSYGDSCLASSGELLQTRQLDRLLAVDWETGVVRAEAGVTLAELIAVALPRGWFLPVTPGTKFVTLGGAVANDVHGKNHHVRGTFGCHVRRFALQRSDQPEPLECSAEQNLELFRASIGGLGLTGVIAWVELQLMPIRSSLIDSTTVRFDSLGEFFSLSEEFDHSHEYTVAWIDCLAKGPAAGRGVFSVGNHARSGELRVDDRRRLSMPLTPPISLMNNLSLRMFNNTYYALHKPGRHTGQGSYDPFFYPLDSILHWNRIYGRSGFQQYQCVIPAGSAEEAMREILASIAASGSGSFLAVMKRCGDVPSPGLLSFPMPGVSLALDFPQHHRLASGLFGRLDRIVREAGGRLYPAKDAHMSAADFQAFYPAWQHVEQLRDPALLSHFWKRVTQA